MRILNLKFMYIKFVNYVITCLINYFLLKIVTNIINVIYKFFRVHFLFKLHSRDINNFDNKNNISC